jgi:uncharacterized membrane protein
MSDQMNTGLTSDDKLWALLAYIPFVGWIIAIVALLMEDKKSRPYIKFHSIQGIILAVINGVVSGILSVVVIGACLWFVVAAYTLYIGWTAYQGTPASVPFVTDFIHKQNWA